MVIKDNILEILMGEIRKKVKKKKKLIIIRELTHSYDSHPLAIRRQWDVLSTAILRGKDKKEAINE